MPVITLHTEEGSDGRTRYIARLFVNTAELGTVVEGEYVAFTEAEARGKAERRAAALGVRG